MGRTVGKSFIYFWSIYFCFIYFWSKSPYTVGKSIWNKEKQLKVHEQNYKLIGIKRLSSGDYNTNKEGYNLLKEKKKRKKYGACYIKEV